VEGFKRLGTAFRKMKIAWQRKLNADFCQGMLAIVHSKSFIFQFAFLNPYPANVENMVSS